MGIYPAVLADAQVCNQLYQAITGFDPSTGGEGPGTTGRTPLGIAFDDAMAQIQGAALAA